MDWSLKDKIDAIESTIVVNGKNLLINLLKLGVRLGIIKNFSEVLSTADQIPNRKFLKEYIKTLLDSDIAEQINDKIIKIKSFNFSFNYNEMKNIIPEYIIMYDYIASMAHYRAISENHPNVLMSFGKDADVWDVFLNNPFTFAYREVVAELLELGNGDKILDVGCGSVSPLFFSERISPNGRYIGIENSKKLASLALTRLRRNGQDWADVKLASIENLTVTTSYDCVICTDLLGYLPSLPFALKNMIKAMRKGGKLVIFDYFPDLLPFYHRVYEFYNSLNPAFRGFQEAWRIEILLNKLDTHLRISRVGNCFIVAERR